jgi:hypothetical protein
MLFAQNERTINMSLHEFLISETIQRISMKSDIANQL